MRTPLTGRWGGGGGLNECSHPQPLPCPAPGLERMGRLMDLVSTFMLRRTAPPPQVALGLERMGRLMDLVSTFMLRRTSAVLKQLLPQKVEQVG